jgi:hypothetical protein
MMVVYCDLLGQGGGGFFSLGDGPVLDFFVGAVPGIAWAGILAIPHLGLLWLWIAASRLFGDTDISGGRILAGMILWALPQALVVGAAEGWGAFAAAWLGVAFGLWVPRVVFKRLRPGVFA